MAGYTIFDVAREAGVSIKTVSRVINGEPNVRAETRAKVLKVADDLDYQPNFSARSLAGWRSFLIGALVDNPSPAYIHDIQMGALEGCRAKGYRIMLEPLDARSDQVGRLTRQMLSTLKPAGVLLTPPLSDVPAVLDELNQARTPYVRIGAADDIARADYVDMDDAAAAAAMTAHLIGLGHRWIAFICGHPDHASARLRHEGFMKAMHEHGLDVPADYVQPGFFSFESGHAAGVALLRLDARPTAIFASNDDMALGAIAAARQAELDVPSDVSICGFDDLPTALMVWPQLTTVHQPVQAMARAAVERLLANLQSARRGHDALDRGQTLAFTLKLRGTTAPPR